MTGPSPRIADLSVRSPSLIHLNFTSWPASAIRESAGNVGFDFPRAIFGALPPGECLLSSGHAISVPRGLSVLSFCRYNRAPCSRQVGCSSAHQETRVVSANSEQLAVHVALGTRSYDISIVSDAASEFPGHLENWLQGFPGRMPSARRAFLITDRNVESRHAHRIQEALSTAGWICTPAVLEPGERAKSLDVISLLYDRLVEIKADRQTVVIAVGGGVVGDAAGFLAATYSRGLPFIQVPTTLLAQVDSSVGGKVGVNHPQAKNLIGAFHQPVGVFIDTSVLDTLPERDYRSGLAEVVKYGVILDAEFFAYLESHLDGLNGRTPEVLRHVVARSCRLKADVVEQDEFERTGLRAVLNYGHTFAHAFEALCGYGELLHGEAVAIGMLYASRLAERLKLIDATVTRRQQRLLESLGLPIVLPPNATLTSDEILDRMRLDKKTVAGKLRFVLPTRLGRVELFSDVAEADVRAVLEEAEKSGAGS